VKSRYLVLIALLVAGLGVLFGTVPSGMEPDGVYVDCGPALFHEWASLPSPDCAGALSAISNDVADQPRCGYRVRQLGGSPMDSTALSELTPALAVQALNQQRELPAKLQAKSATERLICRDRCAHLARRA